MYTESSMSRVYPNLYVLLVAPPGVGKSVAIFQGRALVDGTRKLKLAPDDVTKASLIDHLAKAEQTKFYGKGIIQYHALQVSADEFGVLCPAHDSGFLSVLNALYDNREYYTESRRGRDADLVIKAPQVNLLAGTQPDFLANLLPAEAWGMGFMSRMLMVYAGKSPRPTLFGKRKKIDTGKLLADLGTVCELQGEMVWDGAAESSLVDWYETGMAPEPQHTKLKHYVPRRILTTLKLCIISAISRGNAMVIEDIDVLRAREWLLEIEAGMPDVFKDMGGAPDGELIQELHFYLWNIHQRTKEPIHKSLIMRFLYSRTPAYNVEHIMKLCLATKVLKETMPDSFVPGEKNTLQVE